MNYPKAIEYIESFKHRGIKLGLDRVKKLLKELGDPQDSFRSIHIAGTNGKGSVAAMLSSILTKAGYRTGLYTSPHLVDYTERIRINERDISKQEFADAVNKVKKAVQKIKDVPFTEFEVLTAASFVMLKSKKVDIAVIEVGLGGRLDATNVIFPELCIITNIDMDHMDLLGNTINDIAREKSGIIKNGVPLITTAGKGLGVISKVSRHKCAKLIIVKRPAAGSPLVGKHQKMNAALALKAIEMLRSQSFGITAENVIKGMRSTRWPGRLQMIGKKPLTIIDGAHNAAGAKALKKYLASIGRKFTVIIGMQNNKDVDAYLKEIGPCAKRFIAVRSGNPNAMDEPALASKIKELGMNVQVSRGIISSIKKAKEYKDPICVTGSLYLVGDVLKDLKSHI